MYNKSFYLSIEFFWYEDNDLYFWIIIEIQESNDYIKQKDESEVILINKNNAFITSFGKVIITGNDILCLWHI